MRLPGPACNCWRRIQAAFADGRFDFVVLRVPGDSRIEVVRMEFIERDDDWRICDRIAHGSWSGFGSSEAFCPEPGGHILNRQFRHGDRSAAATRGPCLRLSKTVLATAVAARMPAPGEFPL